MFRRRQADILSPLGTSGLDPIRGLQERNQRNLLEIFSAAKPVIEEMAKVKPESWRNMRGLFTALERGFGAVGQGFLKPVQMLQSRAENVLEGFLAPVMVGINNISNRIEAFALQNQTGATIGAITGGIIGAFFGGHWALGAIFGSMIGSQIEAGGDPAAALLLNALNPFDIIGNIRRLNEYLQAQVGLGGASQTAATAGPVPLNKNITYQNPLTRSEFLVRQLG